MASQAPLKQKSPHFPISSFEAVWECVDNDFGKWCDKLLDKVATMNKTEEFANRGHFFTNLRIKYAFFRKVFADDWGTAMRTHDLPLPLFEANRKGGDVIVKVGVFNVNCPPSGKALEDWEKKRDADPGAPMPATLPHRLAGMPVYVKCIVDPLADGLTFWRVDGKHQITNKGFIRWDPGMTETRAPAMAVRRWDSNEISRIGDFNIQLAVDFTRNRLIRYQCRHDGDETRDKALPTEDFDLFVPLKTASEELDRMKATITEVERLATEKPIQRVVLIN
ncbi:hypothetical protein GE09DRAFT_677651 [Coniochaeta sp. 2T2.1]|nr:hypothetical protein GE09DRAFT_677651 [Coniochaeta sp. 2T2.1]